MADYSVIPLVWIGEDRQAARSSEIRHGSEIEGALHFFFRPGGDAVCVNHRGPDVRMAQERLNPGASAFPVACCGVSERLE